MPGVPLTGRVAGDHAEQGSTLPPAGGRHAISEPVQEITDLLVGDRHSSPGLGIRITARAKILPQPAGHQPSRQARAARTAAGTLGAPGETMVPAAQAATWA